VFGQLLDSARDFLERFWDRWDKQVNWQFFFAAERAKVDQLDDFYFTYYVFNANLVLPVLMFCFLALASRHWGMAFVTALAAAILFYDARSLRGEIAEHTKSRNEGGAEQRG
jgi:hypothetical protein